MAAAARAIGTAIGDTVTAHQDAQKALEKVTASADATNRSMGDMAKTGVSIVDKVIEPLLKATQVMYDASAAGERLGAKLNFANVGGGASEIVYLRDLTQQLGLEFNSTAEAYLGFQGAARGTAMEGQNARDVFESVAKAGAAMGLSVGESEKLLKTFQDALAGGSGQLGKLSDELEGRMPGAFRAAAQAMGYTSDGLREMLSQGKVVAEDFLPQFAQALEKSLGEDAPKAAERLDGAVNRLGNAWERLKKNGGDSGVSSFAAGQYAILSDAMDNVSVSMELAKAKGGGFTSQLAAAAGATLEFLNPLNAFAYTASETSNRLKQAEQHLKELEDAGAGNGRGSLMMRQMHTAAVATVKELRELKKAQDEALGAKEVMRVVGGGAGRGSVNPKTADQLSQEKEERRVYLSDDSRQTRDEARAEEIAKARERNAVLVGKAEGDVNAQLKLRAALEVELGNINEKYKRNTTQRAVTERSEYEAVVSSLQAKIAVEQEGIVVEERLTESQRKRKEYVDGLQEALGKLTPKERENAQALILQLQTLGKSNDARRDQIKASEEASKAEAKVLEDRQKSGEAVEKQIEKLQEEQTANSYAAAQKISLAQAIEEVNLARLRGEQTRLLEQGADGATLLAIQREIEARERLIGLIKTKDAGDKDKKTAAEAEAASKDAAKKAQEQWKATAESINKGLTDAFMKSLESGKDFGKNLANALKEQFKNLVLRPTISAIMKPISDMLSSVVGGFMGSSGSNPSGLLGTISSIVGTASSGTGILGKAAGTVQGWFGVGQAASTVGTGAVTLEGGVLSKAALDGTTAFGANSVPGAYVLNSGALTAAMKAVPWVALIATGMKMAGKAFDEGYRLEDRTIFKSMGLISPMMNIDTRMAQKLGFSERTANIITGASLVAKLASRLGLQATLHTGAGAVYQNGDLTEGRDIYTHGRFGMGDPREYAASAQDAVSTVAARVGVTLDSFFASFGLKPGFKVQTAFADDISKDGAWGSLRIEDSLGNKVLDWMDTKTSKWAPKEFANGEAGWKQYLDAVSDGTIDAFKKSADQLPAWANRIIAAADTAGDDTAKVLETLLQDVAAFPNQLLEKVGTSRDALVSQFVEGLATGDASAAGQAVADTLVQSVEASLYTKAAGQIFDIINTGIVTPMIDALVTGATLTDILSQQTIDSVIQRATATASALNAVMNDPAFAALLEQLRTSTGRALGTAGSQLTYTPRYQQSLSAAANASGNLANATDELTQSYLSAVKSLKGERDNLAAELLGSQGDEKGAKALKRQQYLDGFVDAAGNKLDAARLQEIATLYDANEATRAMIASLERMKQISETLAQELPGVVDKYLSPAQRRQSQYDKVTADLNAAGLKVSTDQLMGLSKAQIGAAAVEIYNLAGVSDEARLAIVRAAGALADLKDADVDNAFAALERAVDAQRTVLSEAITELTTVFETARDAAKSLFGEVESAVQYQGDEGRAFISNALRVAMSTGYLPDSEKFSEAVSNATGALGQQMFATQAESDYQRLVLANELKGLQDISGDQLEKANTQLETLEEQLNVQRQQVEALGGIDASVLSVEQAIDRLAIAMNGAQAASHAPTTLKGAGGASYDLTTGTGQTSSGVAFSGSGIKEAALKAISEGASPQQIYNIIRDSGFTAAQAEQMAGSAPGSLQKLEADMGWAAAYGGTGSYHKQSAYGASALVEPTAYDPSAAGNGNQQIVSALQDVRAELVEVRRQNDQLQYAATRTADAVNGRPEAPMLVENV